MLKFTSPLRTVVFIILLAQFNFYCSQNTETQVEEEVVASAPITPLKKRPKAPQAKKMSEYKIDPNDETGFLLNEETYDSEGHKMSYTAYDYYGSGAKEGTTQYKYDPKGNMLVMDDGQTLNTYSYNEEGLRLTSKWSRPGGQGASEKHSYDKYDQETETKYYTADGTYDFSRVTERTYDDSGAILTEKKWEKYTDGSADLLMYHVEHAYDSTGNLVKKLSFNDYGEVSGTTIHVYDGHNNVVTTTDFEGESSEPETTAIFTYNEYGELIEDKTYNGTAETGILQYTNTYKYDQYGRKTWTMYVHEDGDAWGSRWTYE